MDFDSSYCCCTFVGNEQNANQVTIFLGLGLLSLGHIEPISAIFCAYALQELLLKEKRKSCGQIRHSIFYFTTLQKKYLYPAHKGLFTYVLGRYGSAQGFETSFSSRMVV